MIESNIFSRRGRIYISMVYCQKESTTIVYGPIEFALLIKTFAKGTNSFIGFSTWNQRYVRNLWYSHEIVFTYHNVVWFDTKKLINFHSLSALSAHFWRLCHNELSTKKKDVKHQNSFYYITLKPHKTCLLLALKHELIGGSVLLRRHTVWKFEIFSQFSVKSILPNS